jgi:ribosomal protein RSM22 (predicted rRNA methylase)
MPATYAAAVHVLSEVKRRLGSCVPSSVLDIGAGTGAASLAARALFPDAAIAMLERDDGFARAAADWLPDAARLSGDIGRMKELPPHDLVIAAYALGEMEPGLVWRLWEAARLALVLIEPGTPRGFAAIAEWRAGLLARGANMLAPCPGAGPCPIENPDWCHFAARVERSSLHRRLKGAELNYEDEKFSYVAVGRRAAELPAARVVRRPEHKPGLIRIVQCTVGGIESRSVGRRERETFRQARRAEWGGEGV